MSTNEMIIINNACACMCVDGHVYVDVCRGEGHRREVCSE